MARISILIFFMLTRLSAQIEYQGFVYDGGDNEPLTGATLMLMDSSRSDILAFAITDVKGEYLMVYNSTIDTCIIQVRYLGYKTQNTSVSMVPGETRYSRDFRLEKDEVSFAEIEIQGRRIKREYSDTAVFNAEEYSDGSEQVVEDLVSQLPGVQVDDAGRISYRGKEIDKILIDGDDLFGKDYTVASQNIDADVVEKIEFIDHYEANRLLKGIRKSESQVLNIGVKDDAKIRPYVNLQVGLGNDQRHYVSLDAMGLGDIKYYLLGKKNNIGDQHTSSDFFSGSEDDLESFSVDQIVGLDDFFFSNLDEKRNRENNNVFGSSNVLFDVGDKTKVKINTNISHDDVTYRTDNTFDFRSESELFSINEIAKSLREPSMRGLELKVNRDLSQSAALEYQLNGTLNKEEMNRFQNTSNGIFEETLTNKVRGASHGLTYTHRISDESALTIKGSHQFGRAPQNYQLDTIPDVEIFNTLLADMEASQLEQSSQVSGHEYEFISKYYLRKHGYRLTLEGKHISSTFDYESRLSAGTENSNTRLTLFDNERVMKSQESTLGLKISKNLGLLEVFMGLSYTGLSVDIDTTTTQSTYIRPSFGFVLEDQGKKSILTALYSYGRTLPSLMNLYGDPVMTSYRTLSSALGPPVIFSSNTLLVDYSLLKIYNGFSLNANFIYSDTDENYASSIDLDQSYTIYEQIIAPGSKNYSLSTNISKLIPALRVTVELNSNFSWNKYFNQINDTDFRDNLTRVSSYQIKFKSRLHSKVRMSYYIRLSTNKSFSEGVDIGKNSDLAMGLKFRVKLNSKSFFKVSQEYLKIGTTSDRPSELYLLDLDFEYQIVKNKISVGLTARNMTNRRQFYQNSVSDFYVQATSTRLIPAYYLVQASYRL